jgi:hypothetical protein
MENQNFPGLHDAWRRTRRSSVSRLAEEVTSYKHLQSDQPWSIWALFVWEGCAAGSTAHLARMKSRYSTQAPCAQQFEPPERGLPIACWRN